MKSIIHFTVFVLFLSLCQIAYSDCLSPKIHLQIIRTYKDTAAEELMEIYEGTPLQGSLEFSTDGVGQDHKEVTYDLCLNPTSHTFVALDGNNDGWKDGSYFVLKTYSGVTLLKGTLELYTRQEWTFYPFFTVGFNSQWKYTTENQDHTSWKSLSFDDSSWSSYSAGHFPQANTITRYYRYLGSLPSFLSEFPLAEIGVYNKEGIIIYINEIEVFRLNMDIQNPSFSTPATKYDSDYILRRITSYIPTSLFTFTQVIVAVEIHSSSSILPLSDSFDMYYIPIYGPCNTRSQDGTASATSYAPNYPASNAFDGDIHTLWQFNTLPATLDYTFPEYKLEWINSYTIYTGTLNSNYDISSWKLMASNDGINFVLLDYKTDIVFDTLNSYITFSLPTNSISYNQYRFVILSTISSSDPNTTGQIGEVFLESCTGTILPMNTLLYPSSEYNLITYMSNVFIIPRTNGFTSFFTNRVLPEGLSMNADSGIISGTPTQSLVAPSTISITAVNSNNESSSFSIQFTVQDCTSPNIRLNIRKYNSNKGVGAVETFSLYDTNQQLIDLQVGVLSIHVDTYIQTFQYCIPQVDYQLVLESSDSKGWARGSSLEIYLPTYSNYTILRTSLLNTHNITIPFSTSFTNPIKYELYTTPGTLPSSEWTTSINPISSFTEYIPGTSQVTSQSSLWFFRIFYSSVIPTNAQGIEVTFLARAGAILYINGQEVYRANLNQNEEITTSTVATSGLNYNDPTITFTYTGTIHTLRSNPLSDPTQLLFGLILISKSGYQPSLVDTSFTIRYLYETQSISRTWSITAYESNKVSDDNGGDKVFDNNYYTRFIGYLNGAYPSPQWVEGYFSNERAEAVNAYCIVNGYDHRNYDPLSFVLEGSHDRNIYVELDREINVSWDSRNQRQCYYMFNQNTSYQYYRLSVLSIDTTTIVTNDRFGIAQIEFYIYDYDTIELPPLAYSSSIIEGYIGADLISTFPNHELWNNFDINPALPNGLSIDSGTGIISGIPQSRMDQEYNITAHGPQGLSSCIIEIKVTQCTVPKGLLIIEFNGMGENSYQNGFELRDHNNILQYSFPNFPAYLDKWAVNYCIDSNIYNLVLIDNRGDGWDTGSYIVYTEENSILVTGSVVYGERRKVIRFNTAYLVYSDTNQWSYLQNGLIPTSSWTSISFDTSNWSTARSNNFSNLGGVTQYYRTTFSVPFLQRYAKWEMRLCYTYGAVVYLNGQIIYQYHLPSSFTSETTATDSFNSQTCVSVYGSVQYSSLTQGTSALCIELHGYHASTSILSIDQNMLCSLKLHVESHEGVFGGYTTTSHKGYKDDYYDETEDKAFDATPSTKYYGISTCSDQYLQYNYNNGKKDYINSWSFVRGNMDERVPIDLTLLGSNDNNTWTPLHWRTNIQFGNYYSVDSVQRFNFYNEKAYSMYRIIMNGNCQGGFEASEIQFYTIRIEEYCEAIGNYARQVYGEYSYVSCGEAYKGYRSRYCNENGIFEPEVNYCYLKAPQSFNYPQTSFVGSSMSVFSTPRPTIIAAEYTITITPSLPSGLYLNRNTGVISGIPITVTSETEYRVRIQNSQGYLDTYITLRIDEPTYVAIVIWVLILLFIIIIITVICIIFNRRRKAANEKRKQMKAEAQKLTKALL